MKLASKIFRRIFQTFHPASEQSTTRCQETNVALTEAHSTKMASPELSARLRYLNGSAHLLVANAPATSRYLMSSCNALMFQHSIEPSESQRRKICGACGTIMILGSEGSLRVESERHKRKRSGQNTPLPGSKSGANKAMVYKCGSCGRVTRFPLPKTTPRSRLRSQPLGLSTGANITSASQTEASSTPITPLSTNASSKKRAKARKQSGLEAILAKKKASEANGSGFGLNLMDFMKKS